ncbi:hypothetical protein B296_00025910 [Ensete ventricosum]|uniref:Uncharacterized protein n=1 Tax=Ensete ventricosum TaxID=4639 RepID=A0A426Z0K1_ENSVE|nr:hypothetical protein B296_00025910 [Ensete ventricosum]
MLESLGVEKVSFYTFREGSIVRNLLTTITISSGLFICSVRYRASCTAPYRAYIVGVVDHLYLATRLPLWLTLSSYASTTPIVLAVRDASTGEGIGLTCVRSAIRFLGYRPYLCQVGRTTTGAPIPAFDQLIVLGRPRRRASCPKER